MAAIAGLRFFKFGMVGTSGGVVNLVVLWLCREYLFSQVPSEGLRINLSLVVAITISTANNYCWNRLWTWRDRKEHIGKGFWTQMAEYYAVCWVAIALQMLFTNLLLQIMHYLPANMVAITIAAVGNFLANDSWTFSVRRMRSKTTAQRIRSHGRTPDIRPLDCVPLSGEQPKRSDHSDRFPF